MQIKGADQVVCGTRDAPDLPPVLMTSEPGSFARRTIVERKPQIIRQVTDDNGYPPDVVQALEAFADEMGNNPGSCVAASCPSYLPAGGHDGGGAYDFDGDGDDDVVGSFPGLGTYTYINGLWTRISADEASCGCSMK